MRLSDAVRAEGYGFIVDPSPLDAHGFTALLCGLDMPGARHIACIADSWDHAYSVAHEIAEHRHHWRHTEAMWEEHANLLARWLRNATTELDALSAEVDRLGDIELDQEGLHHTLAENELLASIVRDLAATDARYRTTDGIACGLCGAEFPTGTGGGTPSYVDNHPDHCPLRRACEWEVSRQATPLTLKGAR